MSEHQRRVAKIISGQQTYANNESYQQAKSDLVAKLLREMKKNDLTLQPILHQIHLILLEDKQIQVLNALGAVREITNQWEDIKNTKLSSLILHLYDYLLTSLKASQNISHSIFALKEANSIIKYLHPEQYLVGQNDLNVSVIKHFIENAHKVSSFDDIDEEIDLIADGDLVNITSLLTEFLSVMQESFSRKQYSINSSVIYAEILNNLKTLKEKLLTTAELILTKLDELIKSIQQTVNENKKSTLFIIPDLPIIKFTPLNPRIKPEFLSGYKPKKVESTQKLQHKSKLIKKQLIRDLQNDQKVINDIARQQRLKKKEESDAAFKHFKHTMDDAQLEFKKLKTQQLNIKRHKKKSTKKAGNKQE